MTKGWEKLTVLAEFRQNLSESLRVSQTENDKNSKIPVIKLQKHKVVQVLSGGTRISIK